MPWLVLVYALFILGGGIAGFSISHSWPSIIMGTISAIILICSSIAMYKGSVLGFFTAAGVTFILTVFFSNRFIHSFKFMPGGFLAILSFLVFVVLVAAKIKSSNL
jgi:uncharacterized membrane protein (UPF0136 family)